MKVKKISPLETFAAAACVLVRVSAPHLLRALVAVFWHLHVLVAGLLLVAAYIHVLVLWLALVLVLALALAHMQSQQRGLRAHASLSFVWLPWHRDLFSLLPHKRQSAGPEGEPARLL